MCCLFITGRPRHPWSKDEAKPAKNAENEEANGVGIRHQRQNALGLGNRPLATDCRISQNRVTISNAVQITTTSLPNGTNGLNYSQQLQAAAGVPFGGASPYSWSLSSGSLLANLNLATNGLLSGTAATSGTFNFNVQAADSLGGFTNQSLSINLMSTNIPSLSIGNTGGQIFVLWPASAGTNFALQMTTNLATGPWVPATNGVPQNAFSSSNSAPAVFFRLH